jgi:hypothetical protein
VVDLYLFGNVSGSGEGDQRLDSINLDNAGAYFHRRYNVLDAGTDLAVDVRWWADWIFGIGEGTGQQWVEYEVVYKISEPIDVNCFPSP